MSSPSASSLLGKYRDLVLAIALFLVLDLGVLLFNFFTSHLIENDTARINAAGELRMYSQQLAKSVLSLQHETAAELPIQTSLAQLSESVIAFTEARNRLEKSLSAASWLNDNDSSREPALEELSALSKTWQPLFREADIVLALPVAELTPASLEAVVQHAVTRNVRLMQQASDLSALLASAARERAESMRQIQLAAIAAALLNFVFIVFKFVRRLRQSDRAAEIARQETQRILATVREGLFLIDAEGRIGRQQSASLNSMLGTALPPGTDFFAWIAGQLSEEAQEAMRDYIDLLFNPKVKPSLLKQLNPLRELKLEAEAGSPRYLDFEFEPVRDGLSISFLLVAVSDVTRKIQLQQELAAAELRAKTEVEALLAVLEQAPASVDAFLRGSEAKLAQINADLSGVAADSGAYRQLINKIARSMHGIKGEAALLGLGSVESDIHAFENRLAELRGRRDLDGEDLIPLAVALKQVHDSTARIAHVIERVRHYAAGGPGEAESGRDKLQELLAQVEHLTLHVAEALNKKARLHISAPNGLHLPESVLGLLRTTLPQLVRNAIAHGIEPSEERMRKGKPAEGLIACAIDLDDNGALQIAVHDDGHGLSPQRLRQLLLERGLIDAGQATSLSDQEIIAHIFEPGFSQLDAAHEHAGRGDGLGVVKRTLQEIGGRLRISSRPESYTRFVMELRREAWQRA